MKNKGWVPYPRYIFRKDIVLSLIKKYVPKGSRFLEIGCAAGDIGITLSKIGYNGLMIDFSEEAYNQATENIKKNQATNVRFEKKDFLKMNVEEKFDLITMLEVLEHIENNAKALKKVYGLLRTGGVFIISVPSKAKLWGASDVIVGHIKRYEKQELFSLLKQSGFEVVRLISYGFPWLNLIKYIRDKLSDKSLRKNKESCKVSLTKKSGLTLPALRIPFLEIFLNKYFLFLPMKISSLFNNMDLAEGYICISRKITK